MTIRVEVLYALPAHQWVVALDLPDEATVRTALESPGVLAMLQESGAAVDSIGVWGKIVQPDHRLRDRDRVEIYRDLMADPKTVRRSRAVAARRKAGR
jgi:putative ubiquitin-RnfH superfamily antitoxin RatB of RatAB toxin-antitoxin module